MRRVSLCYSICHTSVLSLASKEPGFFRSTSKSPVNAVIRTFVMFRDSVV